MRCFTQVNKQSLLAYILLYAFLLIIGGIFAHNKQSIVAVVSSVLSGLVVVVGWWLIWRNNKHALLFNLISLLGLASFFIYRWSLTKKFYPPMFLILISFFLIFKILQALLKHKLS